jgi:hypothetical protein
MVYISQEDTKIFPIIEQAIKDSQGPRIKMEELE